jgi:uncharacterized delta-60 repeat protein
MDIVLVSIARDIKVRLGAAERFAIRLPAASRRGARSAVTMAAIIALLLSASPAGVSARSGISHPTKPRDVRPAAAPSGAGSLDATFGSGGAAFTEFSVPSLGAAIAQQSNGELVVAGFSVGSTAGQPTVSGSQVALYRPDGSLDTSFGTGGTASIVHPDNFAAFAVAIQTDGKIVLAGADIPTWTLNSSQFELVRLNKDGSVDTSFGSFGKVTSGPGAAFTLALQLNGQIVAGGILAQNGALTSGVARYNADGSLDSTFGNSGEVTSSFSVAFSLAIQPDGKIVAGGAAGLGAVTTTTTLANLLTGGQLALVRLNADGSLDTGFGSGGQVQNALQAGGAITQMVLQPDGKIVGAGTVQMSSGTLDFALARYNSDGSADASFGGTGLVITNFDGNQDVATGVALQADGKIVVAGSSLTTAAAAAPSQFFFYPLAGPTASQIAVARYNTDGSLDAGFGSGGVTTTPVQQGAAAFAVIIPQDGKILVAGASSTGSGVSGFELAQYDAGIIDGDFSLSTGESSQSIAAGASASFTVSVQPVTGSTSPQGQILLAASVISGTPGLTLNLAPASVNIGGSSTLTVRVAPSTQDGLYAVLLSANAGGITHITTVLITVTGTDFSLSITTTTVTTTPGKTIRVFVQINPLGGFFARVTITTPATLPAGISVLTSTHKTRKTHLVVPFKFKVDKDTAPGTYPIVFTGMDAAGQTRTTSFTLIVQPSS